MSTTEVGIAYVRLLPSMEGFAADVRRELGDALTRPARQAGEDAGREIGKGTLARLRAAFTGFSPPDIPPPHIPAPDLSPVDAALRRVSRDVEIPVSFYIDDRGRLRDSITGRYVSQAEADGRAAGDAFTSGFAGRLDVDGLGDKLKLGLAAAGLAGGALLMEGFSAALDVGDAKARLAAQLGDPEFGRRMGEIAGELYKQGFSDSVAGTGDAVRRVLQNGLLPEDATDDQIERLTAKVLTFSDVLQQDMDMTTQAISSMLRSGLADSADEALDVLTRGLQQGADKSGDLLETFQEYSTMFRDLGIDATDATGLLVQGLGAGARDADKVADALKELAIRAQDGSKASAEGFKTIGLSAADMTAAFAKGGPEARAALDQVLDGLRGLEDPVARNAAAVALFGAQAEDMGDALFSLDLDTAAAGMGVVEGATTELGSAYDTASAKIESFKRRAMDKLVTFIGGTAIPFLERMAEVVGPVLSAAWSGLQGWIDRINFDRLAAMWSVFTEALSGESTFDFAGLMGSIQDIGSALGDAWRAAQPLFDWLGEHSEVLAGLIGGLAIAIGVGLAGAMWSLAAATIAATWPFLAVGAAIAAAVAGITWAYQNVDEFRALVDEVLPKVAEVFRVTFDLIGAFVSRAVETTLQFWRMFGDEILLIAVGAWTIVSGVIMGALDVIAGAVKLVTGIITGDWGLAWEGIKQITSGVIEAIKGIIVGGLLIAWAGVSGAWSLIKAVFSGAWGELRRGARSGIDDVVGFFKGLPGRVTSAMTNLASALTAPFRSAFSSIKKLWNDTVGGFGFSIPSWVPSVGGKKFSIPSMHTGGIFAPATGDEGPALLKRGEGVFTPQQMAQLAPVGQTGSGGAVVVVSADGVDRALLEWLRRAVRVEGGGDVQLALGQRGW